MTFSSSFFLLGAASALSAFAAPTFVQRVEAEFATEAVAARTTLAAAEMPAGKRYAFSTRWDDANMRHDLMSRTLSALGIPSTFYVNGAVPSPAFVGVMSNVLARGSSIGSHTVHHDYLPRLKPMRVFREILENRIALEVASQSPVTTFTLPYSTIGTDADPETGRRTGRALVHAGFIGGAERNARQFETYGLPPERWVASDTFSIDDKNPNAEQFAVRYAAALKRIEAGNCPSGPHLTLGVHSWQSDEGMARLAEILRPVSGLAEAWYCNENEYTAHRVQRFAARIERLSVSGRKAVWRVERPQPCLLGAAVPLACAFSEPPTNVRVDGRELPGGRTAVALPVPDAEAPPKRYVKLADGGLAVDVAAGTVRTEFTNGTDEDLTDVVATLRLPPCCEPGVLERRIDRLAPGAKRTLEWKIVRGDGAEPDDGEFFCAVETNARGKGGRIRFWQSFARAGAPIEGDCPRDRCRVAGPFAAAPVADLVRQAEGRWERAKAEDGAASYAVSAMRNFKTTAGSFVLFDFVFDADAAKHGATWRIRAGIPIYFKNSSFLLNGAAADVRGPVTLANGANRLTVAVPADPGAWGGRMMMSVVSVKDGAGVSYHKVETEVGK